MPASMSWNGDQIEALIADGFVDGLLDAAEFLLEESRKIVPIEEGTLERSGAATLDRQAEEAAVSFDTQYAVPQHEHLDWEHDPGRQAKYLEQPYSEHQDTMLDIIAASTRRAGL